MSQFTSPADYDKNATKCDDGQEAINFQPLDSGSELFIEKTYEEVSPYALYFFKRSHKNLSDGMKSAIDDCILQLSQIKAPQKVFSNMMLTIQPDLNSDETVVLNSGNRKNRVIAFRTSGTSPDTDSGQHLELHWYREGPEAKRTSIVLKVLPYIIFALIVIGVCGYLLTTFVLHDFKLRAQAEGILTVRAMTPDIHHDPLNAYYKLPGQDSDMDGGHVQHPYQGD